MAARKPVVFGPDGAPRNLQAGDAIDRTGDVVASSAYIQTPAADTFTVVAKAAYAVTLSALNGLKTSAGTLTLTVLIGGVAVTGLSAIAVTTTPQDLSATALNVVALSGRVTFAISAVTGAAGLEFTLVGVR